MSAFHHPTPPCTTAAYDGECRRRYAFCLPYHNRGLGSAVYMRSAGRLSLLPSWKVQRGRLDGDGGSPACANLRIAATVPLWRTTAVAKPAGRHFACRDGGRGGGLLPAMPATTTYPPALPLPSLSNLHVQCSAITTCRMEVRGRKDLSLWQGDAFLSRVSLF